MFGEVDNKINFSHMEQQILQFWREQGIFEKSVHAREKEQRFVFYEGPPTANGSPGIHHVLSRLYKDVICRYKTMQGYYVPRKAGWDTHGLPVEMEVENSLGFNSKTQIEEYGIAKFNQRCRESVNKYLREWEDITERIGYWVDMKHPYITFANDYIESCWWIIKQLWDKELIYQGYKVVPHCPRCGTTLSSHEVALGYKDNTIDPSVYIKFRLASTLLKGDTGIRSLLSDEVLSEKPLYLLAWTTTPWTLPGNTALAVAADDSYSIMSGESDYLIVATQLIDQIGLEGYIEAGKLSGVDLIGLRYEPLFNPHDYNVDRVNLPSMKRQRPEGKLTYPVVGADFVSMDEGTGIVHIAPAFGEVDFEAGMNKGLDFVQPVDLEGNLTGSYAFAGKFVKEADPLVLADLGSRGLLYRSANITHTYPFCWRCDSPLLYYAKQAWYIRTTALKDELISGNNSINWYPNHIKYGRFGDWLENNVDWAFSRERYWGTPLPIWRCQHCNHCECVGSREELKAGNDRLKEAKDGESIDNGIDTGQLEDFHRPYIDAITVKCPKCGGTMWRVPEVIDCWFDSGAMPVAQWHYPFENKEEFKHSHPADFICEAIDQTRGWFYSLHALSTLLFGKPSYRNVICLGHVVDEQGEKMSKSKGNVIDPWNLIDTYSADAIRWHLLAAVPGENTHRFSSQMVRETMRKVLLTLWNTYSFFTLYANIDCFVPDEPDSESYSDLDNWVISELNILISSVTNALDNYDPTSAARYIQNFIENLSNYYVRRNRRRFWKSENDNDKQAAYFTLYQCLVTLSRLLAPFIPFVAEEIYRNLVLPCDASAPESVHLTNYPLAEEKKIDRQLNSDVELVIKISSLGRAARAKAGIKVRQPLAHLIIKTKSPTERGALQRLSREICEEVNVKEIKLVTEETTENISSYCIASDSDNWVAIDTELTEELIAEGLSRELVRRLQNMRRSANFNVADHIISYYQADKLITRVLIDFNDYIKHETLSLELVEGSPPGQSYQEKHHISGKEVLLAVCRVN
jgi:isoleucyl-tRNA synthetase